MSESTGGINCSECGMSFDTRDELGRHSRQQHATITERKEIQKKMLAIPQSKRE